MIAPNSTILRGAVPVARKPYGHQQDGSVAQREVVEGWHDGL